MKTCQGISFSSKRFSKHGSVIWNTFIFLAIILAWIMQQTYYSLFLVEVNISVHKPYGIELHLINSSDNWAFW